MPAGVPELLSDGRPDRYDAAGARTRRVRRAPAPVRIVGGACVALTAVAVVAARTHGDPAPVPPGAPAAPPAPAQVTPMSPALLAALRAMHAESISGRTGVVPARGDGPSAGAARAAAGSLLGSSCISGRTANLRVTSRDGHWLGVEVMANPPQTSPFVFVLTWTGSGYSYRFPQIPDACP